MDDANPTDDEKIGQAAGYEVRQETIKLLVSKGPTLESVLLRLRQSLSAKETKTVKLKGSVSKDSLPRGFKVVAKTGTLISGQDGFEYGDGECLLQFNEISHGIRLRAIDLSLQVWNAMPNPRLEHTGKDGGPIEMELKDKMNIGALQNAILGDSTKTD